MVEKLKCPKCNYEWEVRLKGRIPRECPDCKKRLRKYDLNDLAVKQK